MDETVGDVLETTNQNALKKIALVLGMAVYAGGLIYAGLHNWQLFSRGLEPELRIWALLGVISLELSAIGLPLGLHFWFHSGLQRYMAIGFYALDLGLLMLNVIGSFALTVNEQVPGWLETYLFFAPAVPILAALGWSILWLLDPAQRERAIIESLKASTREVLAKRIADQARSTDLAEEVDQAAQLMAQDIIRQTLGVAIKRTSPANVVDVRAREPGKEKSNGRASIHEATAETIISKNG